MGAIISTAALVAEGVAALAAGGVAGMAVWATTKLAGMGVSKMLSGAGVGVGAAAAVSAKMMKAPGQDFVIPRHEFQADPAAWFRRHRS